MICKECGVEINDEARFCPFCGTAQMVEPSDNKNKMSDDKNNDSIKLQKQNAENDESFKHDKSEEGNNVRYKDPVFKTSKNKPEDPKKIKELTFKQKMIDVILVILIIAIASSMIAFRVISARKAKELFSHIAYVKDGILYLDTDIKSESDEPVPVAETSYTLLEYGFDKKIAAFSKDGKYLYYMDKDTGDRSGRLEKVKIDKLTDDIDENSDKAEKVADFVISYRVLDDGCLLYETNDMEVFYYDGRNSKAIAENVLFFVLSYSENYVYLFESDEQGHTYNLGRKGLNSKGDITYLGENVSNVLHNSNSDAVTFIVNNEEADTYELYLTFDNKEPVKIGNNKADCSSYCESAGGLFYTFEDENNIITLYYYDANNDNVIEKGNLSNVIMNTGICIYQKEDSDDWFYMLAGGQEQSLDFDYEYEEGSVWCSADGRYVMIEGAAEDGSGSAIVSFRSTDGTLSSQKLVTENGALGYSEDTNAYYMAYDDEKDETDLYSFHNSRTSLLAKDIKTDAALTCFFAADKLLVQYNYDDNEVYIYRNHEQEFKTDVQEIVYAGKNAVIYSDEDVYYLTYLSGKELETVTLAEGADSIIVPESFETEITFSGN